MADNGTFYWPTVASSGVTTINGLSGAVILGAGTGISITPSGQTLTIASTSAGDVTIGAFGSTPNANGLSINGSQVLNLQPADATHSGGLSFTDWNTFNNKQAALTIGNFTEATSSVLTITGGTGAIIGSGLSVQVKRADTSTSGYLSSTDWNTFNGKQAALTIGDITDVGTDGIVVTGGTGAVIGSGVSIAQHVADTTHSGYLSSADWNTFNGKQAAGNYITALTGDGSASGPGSAALTLATVNSNVGSFAIAGVTVNAKGLVTAASAASTTGSGNVVLATSPTLVTPSLGTPTALVGTNISGTGASFTSGKATNIVGGSGGSIPYQSAADTTAMLANGSAGQVLTSAGGTAAPAWANSPTAEYAQAYFNAGASWTTSNTSSFQDATNSGGNTLTVRQSSHLTLTAAAGNVCGITFTPSSASAVYLIIANTTLYNSGTVANQTYGRLTDGTTEIAKSSGFEAVSGTSSSLVPSSLMGIYVPGTSSAVTVKIQIYGSGAGNAATITSVGAGVPVEWAVIRIF